MKTRWTIALITGLASAAILVLVSFRQPAVPRNHAQHTPKGCVFKTVYEGEGLDSAFLMPTPA